MRLITAPHLADFHLTPIDRGNWAVFAISQLDLVKVNGLNRRGEYIVEPITKAPCDKCLPQPIYDPVGMVYAVTLGDDWHHRGYDGV